jgi:hypothetical protein
MSRNRGKRRSLSQKIGDKAEHLFGAWATDRGLNATLVRKDYGVDFICQVLQKISGSRSEEVQGAVLTIQVRATEGESRPRISLNREDAENLLRQTSPACVIALNPSTGPVAFRFVDETFSKKLEAFLESTQGSVAIRLRDMDTDVSLFDRTLVELRCPGKQFRLRLERVRRQLSAAFPGSAVTIQSTAQDGLRALVKVPWIGSIFTNQDESVRRRVFETGQYPRIGSDADIRPEIVSVSDLADGEIVVAGIAERGKYVTLESSGNKATLPFTVRHFKDEFAWTHPVGITFVQSDRRKVEEEWVHELEVTLFRGEPLSKFSSAIPFLRLMRPGARVNVFGDYEMLLEDWGGSATAIGPSIAGLQALIDRLKIGLDQFRLNDLRDEEFARSVAFANAIFCENVRAEQFVPGFVIGSFTDAEVEKLQSRSVHIEMPVGLNLLSHGVVIWIEAEGTCYLDGDGKLVGLRLSRQVGERVELHTKIEKSSYPEIWVDGSVPPLKIGSEGATVSEFKREGDPPIPFTTKVTPVSDG